MVPTLARTWSYSSCNMLWSSVGNRVTDSQNLLWNIKNALCTMAGANSWQVIASCDKNSYNYGGADLWTGPTSITWSGGSAFSWIILKQPNLLSNYQLLLATHCDFPSTIVAAFSVNAGFTGGNTTTEPTAADQYRFKDGAYSNISGEYNGGYYLFQWGSRASVMMSADGQSTRVMVFDVAGPASYKTSPFASSFMLFDRVVNPISAWTTPVVAMIASNTQDGSTSTDHITYGLLNGNALAYGRVGSSNIPMYLSSEGFGGAVTPNNLGGMYSAYDLPGEVPFSRIGVCSNTAPYRGHLGELADIWWAPSQMRSGSHLADNFNYVAFGNLLVPWNGTQCLYDGWTG